MFSSLANQSVVSIMFSNVRLPHSCFQYYYSIKDISVGGMCICYGHAQSCPWDPVTKVTAPTLQFSASILSIKRNYTENVMTACLLPRVLSPPVNLLFLMTFDSILRNFVQLQF